MWKKSSALFDVCSLTTTPIAVVVLRGVGLNRIDEDLPAAGREGAVLGEAVPAREQQRRYQNQRAAAQYPRNMRRLCYGIFARSTSAAM
jgi:hypothetical protein